MKKKAIVLVLAVVLICGSAIAGSLAWLTDKTEAVTNTFTIGNVDITLAETTEDYKMIPGATIAKDPKVTVEKGSEACWVFVKIEESSNLDTYITYTVDSAWTALEGQDGVYYIQQDAASDDVVYSVLTGDQVTVNNTVTNADMTAAAGSSAPTLTFTAYAIQQSSFTTAGDAWDEVSK